MKVIQWLDKFNPPLGGGPTSVLTLINYMQDVEFKIITNAVSGYPRIEKYSNNAFVHSFLPYDVVHMDKYKGITKPFMLPRKVISEYIRFNNKCKYLEKIEYDILHVNGPEINYGFSTFDRLAHIYFLQKLSNLNLVNKPKLLTLHGMPSLQTNNYADVKNEEKIIEHFDNIICVEKYIYDYATREAKSKHMQKNIWFIPNSIDTTKFNYTMPSYDDKLKVLFIGRLDPVRGLDLVYKLIKNLPIFVELHIIGSGTDNQIINFKSFINGITRIKFYPNIHNKLINQYIQSCDVVLNPVKVESISRTSLEALSCGRPVIMLNIGDRYPTIHGKTGYLIDGEIDELLSLLRHIHENRDELMRFGENGRNIIEKEFSDDIIIPKIRAIYEGMLDKS